MKTIFIFLVLISFVKLATLQFTGDPSSVNDNQTILNPEWSYCYEFTWFGPEYDNVSKYDGSCSDYLDESRAKNVPCSPPIVITYDGTPPDMDYLWEHHKTSILCRRSENQVCASYSYIYNGKVNNITYMCTKVMAVGEYAIESGCYKQRLDLYDVELCVWTTGTGIVPPRGNAFSIIANSRLAFLSGIITIINYYFSCRKVN